jgi:tetratricopeptide (TPR) repeat protein
MVNVPNGVWIDEAGMLVRAAEPAHPGRNPETESFRTLDASTLPEELARVLVEARKIRTEPEVYVAMVRDWVERGADSVYSHTPDEVVARAGARTDSDARAAAHFELGQHFQRAGEHDAAVRHWREAHRLAPDNWTYKRNAWCLEDSHQGPTEVYDGSWFEDVLAIGAENYYPPIEP